MEIKYNMPSVHTILFTEDCPVICRYCDMRAQDTYKHGMCMKEEDFFNHIEKIVTSHITNNPIRILFTGGEPFTKWEWIKKVIEIYGDTIQYSFNTSGYLLTKEIIKFLADYNVTWILSVDGDEQISKWQRPTANGKYDYWETVTKIFPTLLYYFPTVEWKSILSRRIIPFVHRIWASAEQLGFNSIFFVPDFADQPRHYAQKNGSTIIDIRGQTWGEKDFKMLEEQFDLIAKDFAAGLCVGKIRTLEREMQYTLFTILKPELEPDSGVGCGAHVGRKNITLNGIVDESSCCLQSIKGNRDKTAKEIFDSICRPNKCPKDNDCLFWGNCGYFTCIKDNFEETGDYFTKTELSCKVSLIAGNSVINVMSFMNELESPFYADFLKMIKKERVFPWLTIPRV